MILRRFDSSLQMCGMTGSTHLSTWVDAETKLRFGIAGARQGLSESAYGTFADDKIPGVAKNPAEAPDSEKPIKAGISADFSREKLDWRVSVAPMMDWIDGR
jgi:hypothetical protein